LLFLQQHQGLKLQISSISLLNPWLLVSLTLLDARLGQVSTALIHLRLKNYLNEQLTQGHCIKEQKCRTPPTARGENPPPARILLEFCPNFTTTTVLVAFPAPIPCIH
jgi:hypothetical protein